VSRSIEELETHIEVLTEERRRRYAHRQPANGIAKELEQTWEELRRARAISVNGSYEEIHQRARVERELEKLMTDEATIGHL
jgi:hypothetical protein